MSNYKQSIWEQVKKVFKQELSYRKQIARQLRTEYVKGIYNNPVTLKCGLEVTQGYWKWRGSIDHIRLFIGPPL